MGGAQASLCSCWERQKLPTDCPPGPPHPPTRTHEPSARAATAAGGEDDEEVDFELGTQNTFLEYRQVAVRATWRYSRKVFCVPSSKSTSSSSSPKKRSHSLPRSMRPCRDEVCETVIPAAAGVSPAVPERPPLDHPFEPFLTPEMVSAERHWKREVLGRLAWRNVPARPPHSCANTCTQCCQWSNDSWRLAASDPVRVPGHADPCRALHIMPRLPERATVGWRRGTAQ